MSFPLVPRSLADALRERIVFLEGELARVNSRNEDLVNALTATNRAVVPFASRVQKPKVSVPPRLGMHALARKMERATAFNPSVVSLPDTPEFKHLREKQESGG